MLKNDISMNVIRFMLENTNQALDLNFLETLSVENQEYVEKNKSFDKCLKEDLGSNLVSVVNINSFRSDEYEII